MGLLDSFFGAGSNQPQTSGGGLFGGIDPVTIGLLSAGASAFEAGGPSRLPVSTGQAFGKMINDGLKGYIGAQQNQQEQALNTLKMQQANLGLQKSGLELQQFKDQMDRQKRIRDRLNGLNNQGGSGLNGQGGSLRASSMGSEVFANAAAKAGLPNDPSSPNGRTTLNQIVDLVNQGMEPDDAAAAVKGGMQPGMASAAPGGPMSPKVGGPDWLQEYQRQQTQQQPSSTSTAFGIASPAPGISASQVNPQRTLANNFLAQAQIYAEEGDIEGANKLYEHAAKFMPEVHKIEVAMQNGKPVNVITYKDGTQQTSAFAPTPKLHFADLGGKVQPIDEYTGGAFGSGFAKTVSPDTVYSGNISRMNNRDTIRKDYAVAGLNPDGTISGDIETTARGIASGQLPPPSGFALTNPRNQRILARVMEINPDYDFSTVTAKRAAATAFTSGQQGNAMRSISTANMHLDQLGQLADALNNGDVQMVNKVSNAYKTATGNSAPTDFNGIKNIVGQEVVKAIVANGGSQAERDEAAKSFSDARSPEQIGSLIKQYRMVMNAQYQNLLAQRRAAGLPDNTLPKYESHAGSNNTTGAPNPNSQGGAQGFEALPTANKSNQGRTIKDNVTGKLYKSNGMQWVEVK